MEELGPVRSRFAAQLPTKGAAVVVRCQGRRIMVVSRRPGQQFEVRILGLDRREPTFLLRLTKDGFSNGIKTMMVTQVACPTHTHTHPVDAALLLAKADLHGHRPRPAYVPIEAVTADP